MAESNNSFSLLNLEPFSDVINNLIDKLASVVGWVTTRDTPNRHALQLYIKEIEKSDLDPLIKAAKISTARREIKQYINQHRIVSESAHQLSSNSTPELVDDDWIDFFMDKAKLVNNEEMQKIWSRVLARECDSPGSFPLRLIDILSTLSQELANKFLILCNFTFDIAMDNEKYITLNPLIDIPTIDHYENYNLVLKDLQNLESTGLISLSETGLFLYFSNFPFKDPDANHKLSIAINQQHVFDVPISKDSTLNVGNVQFTECGEALFSILSPMPPKDFAEHCFKVWSRDLKNKITWVDETHPKATVATND